MRRCLLIALLLSVPAAAHPLGHRVEFKGHRAIELDLHHTRMVITVDTGPRIAYFGRPGGPNLLFWDTKGRGRGAWKLRGGHRVWVTRPGADESEEAYAPDNRPCTVRQTDHSVTVYGAEDPVHHTCRGITVSPGPNNQILVDSFVQNRSDMLWSGGVWASTCTAFFDDVVYAIPLGSNNSWDTFPVIYFRRWAGHTSRVNDPQLHWHQNVLLIRPQGIESKRMLCAPAGIVAMCSKEHDFAFLKKAVYYPSRTYPMGCNVAYYIGPGSFMVELETLGWQTTVKPGQTLVHREVWLLDHYIDPARPKSLIDAFR